MVTLLNILELRSILKRAMKEDKVLAVHAINCDPVFVRIQRLGYFTVTFDVYDADEETWLATETISIKDIFSINEASVERVRLKLIYENTPPAELEEMKAAMHGVHEYDPDDDELDDEEYL